MVACDGHRLDDGVDLISCFQAHFLNDAACDAGEEFGTAHLDMDDHARPRAEDDAGDYPREDVCAESGSVAASSRVDLGGKFIKVFYGVVQWRSDTENVK